MIDLHGAPGSQNGQDNSGLIGPVLFASNTSNEDRSLNVLRNLTEEFSQSIYGGAVTAIELLNEPRLDDDDFTMSSLKDFYADGAEVVSSAGSDSISVAIHGMYLLVLTLRYLRCQKQATNSYIRRILGSLLLVHLHALPQHLRLLHNAHPHPRHASILRLPTLRQPLPLCHPLSHLRNFPPRQEFFHPAPHRRRRIQPRNQFLTRLRRRRRRASSPRWAVAGAEDVVSIVVRGASCRIRAERSD